MTDLVERFARVVQERGDAPAILDERGVHSFREVARQAEAIARVLHRRGAAPGRVALLAQGADWVEGFFGVLSAGGTVVPLSAAYPVSELRWFIEASGARALLADEAFAALAQEVAPELHVPLADRGLAPAGISPGPARDASAPALLLYTSGTTGRPKGALLGHDNVLALCDALGSAWGFSAADTLLHTLPLHHLHGVAVSLLVSVLAGAATRMLPRFDAPHVWRELAGSTTFMGVPTQHRKLFDAFDAADAATRAAWEAAGRQLRLVTSGSAALPPALGARWERLNGRYPLERYGMTEVGIVLGNPLHGERRPGTVGKPIAPSEIRVVDEAGGDVASGEAGELWIRGPAVFAGYDGDDAATRAAFRGEGWFVSGDTARVDEDGYVTLLGRTSVDILKSGGYKLSALEIENVLREHDAVADVAVIGLPDAVWGDRVVAAMMPAPGREAELEAAALRTWAKERLASYKVPKEFVVVDELPRNALGKVTKRELARRLGGSRD